MRKYWFLYLLAVPGLVFMLVFDYGPMYGILLAFKDYKMNLGVWGSPWVGFAHFRELFADPVFLQAFKNTVIINVYNLLFGFSFNVFFGADDQRAAVPPPEKRGADLCVPALLFVLGYFLRALCRCSWRPPPRRYGRRHQPAHHGGGRQPGGLLKRPELFRGILVITNIIKTAGYSTIIYLAAIAG